jgi:hypothetical protein
MQKMNMIFVGYPQVDQQFAMENQHSPDEGDPEHFLKGTSSSVTTQHHVMESDRSSCQFSRSIKNPIISS